jgi:hypothetical protein
MQAKVRIAAIGCVQRVVYARGAEVIRDLTGFREANVVPIKAFYDGLIEIIHQHCGLSS